ncbi:MAG: hypothetical protein HC804_06955 [Anaerolineae bacterium]|nr:hypothetical protein [Anaerolineae bacterium]
MGNPSPRWSAIPWAKGVCFSVNHAPWHCSGDPNRPFPASYRVFVHLLDAQGTVIAQSDSIPGEWTRPTTGWMPGEYILDHHMLPAAPVPVTAVRVGLYLEDGSRLQTAHGETFISFSALAHTP